jgi:hypothetical protein
MNWAEQANMRYMTRDLRLLKSRSTVQTHQGALELSKRDQLIEQTEGGGIALFASTLVKLAQRHLLPHSVRRTNKSKDWEGNAISAALPVSTFVHVAVEVTEAESIQSYKDLGTEAVTARYFDAATFGVSCSQLKSTPETSSN